MLFCGHLLIWRWNSAVRADVGKSSTYYSLPTVIAKRMAPPLPIIKLSPGGASGIGWMSPQGYMGTWPMADIGGQHCLSYLGQSHALHSHDALATSWWYTDVIRVASSVVSQSRWILLWAWALGLNNLADPWCQPCLCSGVVFYQVLGKNSNSHILVSAVLNMQKRQMMISWFCGCHIGQACFIMIPITHIGWLWPIQL